MIYLSGAIVISIIVICVFGLDININRTYEDVTEYEKPEITFKDIYNADGDPEYDGQVTMDEYIGSINDLMVGNDKEIN